MMGGLMVAKIPFKYMCLLLNKLTCSEITERFKFLCAFQHPNDVDAV